MARKVRRIYHLSGRVCYLRILILGGAAGEGEGIWVCGEDDFGGAAGEGCVCGGREGEETEVDARKIFQLRAKRRCPIFQG